MSVSFCLPHPVAVSAFMICRGLYACTERRDMGLYEVHLSVSLLGFGIGLC